MKFGEILKTKRKENEVSINKLSKITGVSTTYISKLENFQRKYPSINILFDITYGFLRILREKYFNSDKGEEFIFSQIKALLSDFVNATDSNLKENEKNSIYERFESYYNEMNRKLYDENTSNVETIYENKVKMDRTSEEIAFIESPNYDLSWLLSQNDFEIFYGRHFLTNSQTIEKQKLTQKSMYYYNILDKDDLITIKKLIEVYLESKYPRIKNPKDFYYSAIDDNNLKRNTLDWYHLD
ncbi:helix-turn-helix transcriptional regulator [Staphylococcus chromogenes]|uniref:helix-turn-helix domain-containing protein n=1 Tax=Staphylococcus chromogenes TaxID=46126 RepID=UPI002901EC1A|nr:helix-turn-helix transcriptional regulator [Staphylococcus chromogenes]MDU0477233.1 helix-turn-helix transcriptional regulator [Staphylococcus chromogenes]